MRYHIEKFVSNERDKGYKSLTISDHLYTLINFDDWLTLENLTISELNSKHISDYLEFRKDVGYTGRSKRNLFDRFLCFLETEGVIEELPSYKPSTPQQQMIQQFASHLENDRGYSQWTIISYTKAINTFLTQLFKKKHFYLNRCKYQLYKKLLLMTLNKMVQHMQEPSLLPCDAFYDGCILPG